MLGSAADAEDVLQESYLRWSAVDPAAVEHSRAYLVRVVTRHLVRPMITRSFHSILDAAGAALAP
ncbi:sigma factor, partial [Streptomyces decoyicus]